MVENDGNHVVPQPLEAVLRFFPLDSYVENAFSRKAVVPEDSIHLRYGKIMRNIGTLLLSVLAALVDHVKQNCTNED
jgi:L-fucose mutarotase/ribose pyranase (RbsD/FucU family)